MNLIYPLHSCRCKIADRDGGAPVKMSLALLAVVISSLSLAWQLKGQKPVPPLEKFMVPSQSTELGVRLQQADIRMMRDSVAMSQGIGVPFVRDMTSDHQHLIVRTLVSEQDLPQGYDERKKALMMTALLALGDVSAELDLEYSAASKLIVVEFVSAGELVKKPNNNKIYAEYRGGELTFH